MNKESIRICGSQLTDTNQISMLEAQINYTRIWFNDGNTCFSSYNIGIFELRLKPFNFFRINRKTIINLNFIQRFDASNKISDNRVTLKNNLTMPISRRRTMEFMQKMHVDKY